MCVCVILSTQGAGALIDGPGDTHTPTHSRTLMGSAFVARSHTHTPTPAHTRTHAAAQRTPTPAEGAEGEDAASLRPLEVMLSGAVARTAAQLIAYPIDATRTYAQLSPTARRTFLNAQTHAHMFNGCIGTSLFTPLIGGLQFVTFEYTQAVLRRRYNSTQLPFTAQLCSSLCAGVASCVASVPQEVLKQRMVIGMYPSMVSAIAQIYTHSGLLGFYAGGSAAVARNVPFVCTAFTVFAMFKQWHVKRERIRGHGSDTATLSLRHSMAFGMASAAVACVVTHPADVVKTRLMTDVTFQGPMHTLASIVANEGTATLFSGFFQRLGYVVPLWALQFCAKEKIVALWGAQRRRGRRSRSPGLAGHVHAHNSNSRRT